MEHWKSLANLAMLCMAGFLILANYYWLLKKPVFPNRPPVEILYEPDPETDGEAEVEYVSPIHHLEIIYSLPQASLLCMGLAQMLTGLGPGRMEARLSTGSRIKICYRKSRTNQG